MTTENKKGRTSSLRYWSDINTDIHGKIDESFLEHKSIKKRGGGEFNMTYIPWHKLCVLLDRFCPGWSWEIIDMKYNAVPSNGQYGVEFNGSFYLVGKLTVQGLDDDGSILKRVVTAGACEQIKSGGYGDPMTNASASALRRACGTLGIARYLWDKSRDRNTGGRQQAQQKPQMNNAGFDASWDNY